MKEKDIYEKKLDEELERRIAEMESDGYEFPKRFGKRDYIITVAVVAVCLVAVIAGGFIR